MTDLNDRLDEALAHRLAGQPSLDDELKPLLAGLDELETLRKVPTLDATASIQGKRVFLTHARKILLSTPDRRNRRAGIPFLNLKEISSMSSMSKALMASFLAIVILVFGGGGAAAFAAQSSLPNDALYGVKLTVEDARLLYTSDPTTKVTLSTEFVAQRINEMTQLAAAQRPIPPELLERLNLQLSQALWFAAGMNTPQASLDQILQMTEEQSLVLTQARSMAPNDPNLEHAAQYLEIAHNLTQAGMIDPNQFRQQMFGQNGSPMPPSGMPTMMPSAMPTMMPTGMPGGGGGGGMPGGGMPAGTPGGGMPGGGMP